MTLGEIFEGLFGADAPVRFSAYDGSTAGDPDAKLGIRLTNPRGVSYLATAPGSLGMARAYIKGDLDIEGVHPGDPYEMLKAIDDDLPGQPAADVPGRELGRGRSVSGPSCRRRCREQEVVPPAPPRPAALAGARRERRSATTTTCRTRSTSACSARR